MFKELEARYLNGEPPTKPAHSSWSWRRPSGAGPYRTLFLSPSRSGLASDSQPRVPGAIASVRIAEFQSRSRSNRVEQLDARRHAGVDVLPLGCSSTRLPTSVLPDEKFVRVDLMQHSLKRQFYGASTVWSWFNWLLEQLEIRRVSSLKVMLCELRARHHRCHRN